MMYTAIYKLMCLAYREVLRDLLKKAIDDPNEQWDDVVLEIMDKLFSYEGD